MITRVSALFLAFLAFAGPALAETREFEDPMLGRFRLDYCRYTHQDCGIAAAFAFCQREGFTQIVNYHGERDIGTTMRIGDRSVCREDECDGFSLIVCTREGPPRIVDPNAGRPVLPERPHIPDDYFDGEEEDNGN